MRYATRPLYAQSVPHVQQHGCSQLEEGMARILNIAAGFSSETADAVRGQFSMRLLNARREQGM